MQVCPGTFQMGSPVDEPGREADEVQHQVTITRPFLIGATEVTQGQWEALAVDEALVNAICHGNGHDETKRVRFTSHLSPDRVRVEISDEGAGFDPDSLPDPTAPNRIGCPGGRGVLLMRAFMSRVEFSDHGSRVVLEKDRDALE